MKSERFWESIFLLIYWSDWFVMGVFVSFILLIWYYMGVFQYSTFAGIGDFNKWTWGTLAFFLLLPHFIVYLAYFPRSFRIKRRRIYFSDFNHPLYIFFAFYFILAYFIITTYGWYAIEPFPNLTPGSIALAILSIIFILVGFFFLLYFYVLGLYAAYKLLIDGYWYRKFGLEPITWEEMLAKMEGSNY